MLTKPGLQNIHGKLVRESGADTIRSPARQDLLQVESQLKCISMTEVKDFTKKLWLRKRF